jgi:hypothetical protein
MKANICGRRYQNINGNWATAYNLVIDGLHSLGVSCHISPQLNIENVSSNCTTGIKDSPSSLYVYNHTHLDDLTDNQFYTGKQTLIIKPTGPSSECFSIDEIGYAASSSITYTRPNYESVDEINFFSTTAIDLKESACNKWSNRPELSFHGVEKEIPKDHILILGQMPGDETVRDFSFGNHWDKFTSVVSKVSSLTTNIVIKVHPTLEREAKKTGRWEIDYKPWVTKWLSQGLIVLWGFESLHSILPFTRVAITENSTAGIDCLLYDVPVISYGYPEYHWVTYDLRHLTELRNAITNLSWHNKIKSRKWLTWYCSKYLCYDYDSTVARLLNIIDT